MLWQRMGEVKDKFRQDIRQDKFDNSFKVLGQTEPLTAGILIIDNGHLPASP